MSGCQRDLGPSDPHLVEPGHAPTPFTATEIRQGVRRGGRSGCWSSPHGSAFICTTRFVDCDEQGEIHERAVLSVDGDRSGRSNGQVELGELQARTSLPAARTAISEESLDTPLGRLDCLRSTVADGPTVGTIWFAKVKSDAVRLASEIDGAVTNAVTMIGDE
jgi:hypothetical protein